MNPHVLSLLRLFGYLPLPLLHGVGVLLGWLSCLVPNPNKTVTLRNLELCFPELDDSARRGLARRSLIEMAKTLMETPAVWLTSGERTLALVREVVGAELIEQGLKAGKGLIMVSPHLGNWEICGLYLARYGITSLYRPPRQDALEEMIRRARERLGARLVPTNAKGVRALYQALAQGGMIGILPDQDPRDEAGAFAPLFGVPAKTMTLLPRLAQKSGAQVIFTFAERLPWGHGFRLHFLPAPAGIDSSDSVVAATALNQGVENCIRLAPQQYQWAYKRFRTRPAGEPSLYP